MGQTMDMGYRRQMEQDRGNLVTRPASTLESEAREWLVANGINIIEESKWREALTPGSFYEIGRASGRGRG